MAGGLRNGTSVSLEDEKTEAVASQPAQGSNPYLDLHVFLADGGERWLSVPQGTLALGDFFPEGQGWTAEGEEHAVAFLSQGEAMAAFWRGQFVRRVRLSPGESLDLGGTKIWLVDARRPESASLDSHEGLETPRHWSLRPQPYRIGRRSSTRHNHLEIAHPTVSRAQATLLPADNGGFALLVESSTSPTSLNGRPLQVQQLALLHHGDLIKVGDVSLRFRQSGQRVVGQRQLSVHSLGRFRVQWGELVLVETAWKVEKSSWLLARLAWSWGQPVSTDEMMEMLWPELPALRGRKNLSHCLANLKQILEIHESAEELVLRTPANLQLNPDFLADHDASFLKILGESEDPAAWHKALDLYQGPYLPGNFGEWAELIRRQLLDLVLDCAVRLSRHHARAGNCTASVSAARRGLRWNGCHEGLALLATEGYLQQGSARAAIDCVEAVSQQLRSDLGVEPCAELVRAYGRARAQVERA